MKKLLTVLLVIAVMFTFSFGSAMAYSWETTTTQAGLESAQAEAIAYINSTDLSVYDSVTKLAVQAQMASYIAAIGKAITVGTYADASDDTVLGLVYDFDAYLEGEATSTALVDAKVKAMTQFADYVAFYGLAPKSPATYTSFDEDAQDETGFVGIGDASFDPITAAASYTDESFNATMLNDVAYATIYAAQTEKDVQAALDKYLAVLDKAVLATQYKKVTDEEIDALVKAIRAEAGNYNVRVGEQYSAEAVAEYNALIEEAVKAAKACKTQRDLAYVYYDYLGKVKTAASVYDYATTAAQLNYDGVLVVTTAQSHSAFYYAKQKNKTVEKKLAAVKAILADLGAYDYTLYPNDAENETWVNVENFYYEANYFLENNEFTGSLTGLADTLNSYLTTYAEAATATAKQDAIDAVVDAVKDATILGLAKTAAASSITNYTGETLQDVAATTVTDAVYSASNVSLINSIKAAGIAAVKAATTVDAVKAAKKDTLAKIDAVDTLEEKTFKDSIPTFNAALDQYADGVLAAMKKGDTVTYSTKAAAIEKLVEKIKANYKDGETTLTFNSDLTLADGAVYEHNDATNTDIADLFASSTDLYGQMNNGYLAAPTSGWAKALGYVIDLEPWEFVDGYYGAPVLSGYTEEAKAEYDVYSSIYQNYLLANSKYQTLEGVANAGSWEMLFNQYTALSAEADAIVASYVTYYNYLVNVANAAIAKIPATLDTSYACVTAVETTAAKAVSAAEAFYAEIVAAEYEVEEVSFDAYYDAQYKLDRIQYEEELAKVTANETTYVGYFNTIAANFLDTVTTGIAGNVISKADRAAANTVIQETVAAITAAKTNADQKAAAKAGIAKLRAFEEAYDATDDLADLADKLADAKAYFNKYYKAAFNSDATSGYALAQDVAKFQDKLLGVTDVKALVAGLKLTARSVKTAKGNVKVTINGDVSALTDLGYKVEYKFYKSNKKASGYKVTLTKTDNVYTNTKLAKGKNYYKAKVVVKDAAGTVVGTTALTQCKYAVRTIK